MKPHTILLAVDVQRDFVHGTLGAPDRERVINPLMELATAPGTDIVVCSRDWHPADHSSFEANGGQWPEHCVAGTPGAQLSSRLQAVSDFIVDKGMDPDREAYSAFEGVVRLNRSTIECEGLVRALGTKRLIIGGLCTDYCVRATVLDALRLGPSMGWDVVVPLDTCAGVAEDTTEQAIGEMRDRDAIVVDSWQEAI